MANTWTIEDAKNDFGLVAEAAYAGEPQYVTNHSHPELVIITKKRYDQLDGENKEENRKFIQYLMSGPKGDIFPDGYEPTELTLRDVEF